MIPLTDNENRFYEEQKECYMCGKKIFMIKMKKRNLNYTEKLQIIVIIQEHLE